MEETAQNVRPLRLKLDARVEYDEEGRRHLLINGEPLMGMAEAADALGVRAQNLLRQTGLPEPIDRIRASRFWLGSEIREFAERRQERKVLNGQ